MIELTAVGPMVACLRKKIILRKSSPRRFTWWFPGDSMWSQELCLRKAHIEVEGRLMGHILTEFLQQTSHCCFRGHSCISREMIFAIIDKVVTYIYVQYFGMFFEFYSSSAKESSFGWGNPIHLQHSWLWCWRFWRWQKIHAGCLSCCINKSTEILSLYLAKFECLS